MLITILIKLYQCWEKICLHWPKTLRALAEVLDSIIGLLAGFNKYECIALICYLRANFKFESSHIDIIYYIKIEIIFL